MIPISFQNIGKVIDYLVEKRGIRYIDTPWIIPTWIKNITYIGSDVNVLQNGLCLVGSAEQGFIYLQVQDTLENNYTWLCYTKWSFENYKMIQQVIKLKLSLI